jgi:hypothetical protein
VNVADWDGTKERNLIAHEPQLTDVVVELGPKRGPRAKTKGLGANAS